MHFEGTVEIAAPRDRVWAFVIDPEPGRPVRPGRRVDRGHRRHPLQGDGQGRHRVHQRPVRRQHGVRRARPPRTRPTIKAHGQAPGSAVDADAADAPVRRRRTAARRHGLGGRRQHRGHARERRRAADRGHGQQDDRPDLRLHEDEARGDRRTPDRRRWSASTGSSARSRPTSTSSPTRARARRSRSTPRPRRSPGSPTSWPRATGRSSSSSRPTATGTTSATTPRSPTHTGADIAVHPLDRERLTDPQPALGAVRDRRRPCRPSSWPRAA